MANSEQGRWWKTPGVDIRKPVLTPLEWIENHKKTHISNLGPAQVRQSFEAYICHYNPGPCTARAKAALKREMLEVFALIGAAIGELTGISDAIDCAGLDAMGCVWLGVGLIPGGKVAKPLKIMLKGGDEVAAAAARAAGKACSFSGDTNVLMADGTTKPISEIKIGDEVFATDPETGEQGPRAVAHLWVHEDTLVALSVDRNVLITTEDHPYWNATDRQWQRADELDRGDSLLTPSGALVAANGFVRGSLRSEPAYNLTVHGIRTYYVLAGDTPVLVHNTNGCLVSMDDALTLAARHVGDNPTIVRSGSGGVQFMSVTVDSAGNTIRKIARFDVNPNSAHVKQWGPHLNLETQINGRTVTSGPLSDPHMPIDQATIRNGDWWD